MRNTYRSRRATILAELWAAVSLVTKGCIVAWTVLLMCFLFLLQNYFHICAIIIQYLSYTDMREVLQQEYSQPLILPSPHFLLVVNAYIYIHTVYRLGSYVMLILPSLNCNLFNTKSISIDSINILTGHNYYTYRSALTRLAH